MGCLAIGWSVHILVHRIRGGGWRARQRQNQTNWPGPGGCALEKCAWKGRMARDRPSAPCNCKQRTANPRQALGGLEATEQIVARNKVDDDVFRTAARAASGLPRAPHSKTKISRHVVCCRSGGVCAKYISTRPAVLATRTLSCGGAWQVRHRAPPFSVQVWTYSSRG